MHRRWSAGPASVAPDLSSLRRWGAGPASAALRMPGRVGTLSEWAPSGSGSTHHCIRGRDCLLRGPGRPHFRPHMGTLVDQTHPWDHDLRAHRHSSRREGDHPTHRKGRLQRKPCCTPKTNTSLGGWHIPCFRPLLQPPRDVLLVKRTPFPANPKR